jgi:hypothetical protein
MSLTNNVKLRSPSVSGDFPIEAATAVVAEGGIPLAITVANPTVSGDWAYSAAAEGRTGEVAVDGFDGDDLAGMVYTGPSGGAFRVKFTNVDIDHGIIAPEATDTATVAVVLNNTVVAYADEGYVAELDAEPAIEFNCDTYVGGLVSGDVIRIAILGGGEETLDLAVAEGGTLDIV